MATRVLSSSLVVVVVVVFSPPSSSFLPPSFPYHHLLHSTSHQLPTTTIHPSLSVNHLIVSPPLPLDLSVHPSVRLLSAVLPRRRRRPRSRPPSKVSAVHPSGSLCLCTE